MELKDHILRDIKSIDSPHLLHQVFEYIQIIKQTDSQQKPNRDKVIKFAGLLSKAEAKKMTSSTSKEFSKIEGEW
jgi:hypothetical protein